MNFIHPDKIVPVLELVKGMKIADFGCGNGIFTIIAAKAIGTSGEIFAIDVQKGSLESVAARAKQEGLNNIKGIWADLEIAGATKISSDSMDRVFIFNTLFQSKKKNEILKEAKRVLSTNGKLFIIDWQSDSLDIGPKEGFRISKEEMIKLSEETGLKFVKDFEAGDYHYGLIFEK